MPGSVTSMATRAADPVFDATSAAAFWKELPRRDPVAAQKALCELLAGLLARESPGVEQLQALLALDRRADSLVDALLVNYVSGDAEPPTLEKAYWQAAFELARSFGRIHGHFLKSVRDREHYRRWRDYLPSLLARLFHHRQTELLLRPYVDELSTGFSWREVHEAYEYAQSLGVLLQSVSVTRCRAKRPEDSTLQQEYIHVLVQDMMNLGHFSPHEAFWVSQGIPRWCHALTLLPDQARAGQDRFVVDLNSDEGPVRSSVDAAGTRICFDTAPALASISDEMLELRDSRDSPNDPRASGRSRHLKLLRKVNVLFTAKQQMIRRRGERKRAARAVEIIIGLAQVIGALRRRPPAARGALPPLVPDAQQSTFAATGGTTGSRIEWFLQRRERDFTLVDQRSRCRIPALEAGGPQRFGVPPPGTDLRFELDDSGNVDRVSRTRCGTVDAGHRPSSGKAGGQPGRHRRGVRREESSGRQD